ncbi:MAG: hypothetical protein JRI68_28055 [Deltaproteobacteria bacterium]|nr:hypothetical protein [Deltaproteobacteria bacterium]
MGWSRLLLVIPFALLVVVAALELSSSSDQGAGEAEFLRSRATPGRLFLIIVDSLRPENLDGGEMPHLVELSQRPDARRFPLTTCVANYSVQCLQTLLEGRESPFGADVTRFTGTSASADSLSGLAQQAGKRSLLLSYHEIVKLYGPLTTRTINTGHWKADYLPRDIRAVDETIRQLAELDPEVVILHIDGTDKAAHYKRPGTKPYRDHFATVDGKLRELSRHLDFERDFVLFTGDHGHNAAGHHTRQSVALFVGAPFARFIDALALPPDRLMARDLLFFFGYALGAALPEQYEGAYFDAAPAAELPSDVRAFLQLQVRTLATRGYPGDALAKQLPERRHVLERRSSSALHAHLPMLLCFLGMLLWWQARRPWAWRAGAIGGFGALAVLLTLLGWQRAGSWLAVPVGLAALAPLAWPESRRRTAFLVALIALATTIGFWASDWTALFHNYGGLRPVSLLFFLGILVAGWLLAWLRDGPSRTPWATLAYCMFCLPSGVYYYHAGQNMLHGFAFGLLAVLVVTALAQPRRLVELARRHWHPRLIVPLILFALCTSLLFMQGGGAWRWNHLLRWTLDPWGRWPVLLFYYPVGLLLLARLKGTMGRRVSFAVVWVGCHLYAIHFGNALVTGFVTAWIPLLCYFAWDELQQLVEVHPSADDEPATLDGLLLFGAILTGVWFVFSGFSMVNIEWTFAEPYLGWVVQQKHRFLLSGIACVLKYACPTIAALTYLYLAQGPQRTARLLEGVLFFLLLKLAALLAQAYAGALGAEEKLYQLAAVDMVFVAATFVTVSFMLAVFIIIESVKRRRARTEDALPSS